MLIDNNRKFETSFELAGSVPKLFIYFDEPTSDNIIKEFKTICDFLKKEVFDTANISFLEINAGIQQETFKKYSHSIQTNKSSFRRKENFKRN